jgi:hypothetical protein
MSLPRDPPQPVLVETARVARAAFPTGNLSMRISDEAVATQGSVTWVSLIGAATRKPSQP